MSAPAKQLWRNAATLILAVPKYPGRIYSGVDDDVRSAPHNEIRAAINPTPGGEGSRLVQSQFDILTLRRSSGNVFMPGAHVFPGGGISDADFNPDWVDIFNGCGVSVEKLFAQFNQNRRRPRIVRPEEGDSGAGLPKDIAYRICALRETFEEAGVLLARDKQKRQMYDFGGELSLEGDLKTSLFSRISKEKFKKWQHDVQEDESNFIRLFREIQCCPDVASLHEWSNWLTPSSIRTRRYDTIFYLTTRFYKPDIIQDDKEMDHSCWLSASDVVEHAKTGQINIPPPQVFECGRITSFKDLVSLEAFAKQRSVLGVESLLPVLHKTTDEVLFTVLRGDYLYPSDEDIPYSAQSPIEVDRTLDELKREQEGKSVKRVFFTKPPQTFINIDCLYGHITPLCLDHRSRSQPVSRL